MLRLAEPRSASWRTARNGVTRPAGFGGIGFMFAASIVNLAFVHKLDPILGRGRRGPVFHDRQLFQSERRRFPFEPLL